jgi:alanyl-tRNA synthetase
MQKRANVLKQSQPESVHVLLKDNTILIALNGANIKTETANSVSKTTVCLIIIYNTL